MTPVIKVRKILIQLKDEDLRQLALENNIDINASKSQVIKALLYPRWLNINGGALPEIGPQDSRFPIDKLPYVAIEKIFEELAKKDNGGFLINNEITKSPQLKHRLDSFKDKGYMTLDTLIRKTPRIIKTNHAIGELKWSPDNIHLKSTTYMMWNSNTGEETRTPTNNTGTDADDDNDAGTDTDNDNDAGTDTDNDAEVSVESHARCFSNSSETLGKISVYILLPHASMEMYNIDILPALTDKERKIYFNDRRISISTCSLKPNNEYKHLAVGIPKFDINSSKPRVLIIDLSHKQIVNTIEIPQESNLYYGTNLQILSWSPDGKLLAIGHFGDIFIWNSETGKIDNLVRKHSTVISNLVWNPDGKLLVSSDAQYDDPPYIIKIWNIK